MAVRVVFAIDDYITSHIIHINMLMRAFCTISLLSLLPRSTQQEPLLHIKHPPHQSSTNQFLLNIEIVQIDPNDPLWQRPEAVFQICVEIVQHDFFFRKFTAGETASKCWNDVDVRSFFPLQLPTVELLIYDNYTISAKVSTLADQELSVSTSTFSYSIGAECQNKLNSALGVVQVPYNSIGDIFLDPYHKHHLSPLCLTNDDVTYLANQKTGLGPYLSTSSGFRGTFGVDHTSQEFGHGDTMMLHYILSLYRGDLNDGHFVEFGCFAGMTSLTLGVAASLRGTKDAPLHFHSYDIIDMRPENVKRTWLPNMFHHILNVDACHQNNVTDDCNDLFQILSNTSLMMVDHDHATRLAAAVRFGRLLKPTQAATLIVHDFPAGNTIQEWQHAMAKVGYELVHENMRSMFVSTLACFRRTVTL